MQVDIQPEEASNSGESKDKDQDTKGSSSLVISKVGLGAI